MNVKLRQVIYSLGIVAVMLLSTNVYSQPQGDSFNRSDEMRKKMKAKMLEVFKQLDLSPEQEKQLNIHRKRHREQGKEIHTSIRAKREAMKEELQKQALDMEKINKIHSEMKSMHSKKADHRLEGILEVRKILTTEQFVKFMELRKNLHSMKKRREGL